MFFDNVPRGPPDIMYRLKHRADNDPHPQKIDLGVGIYRNEEGRYHELQAVTQAKRDVAEADLGHDYEMTTGRPEFLEVAAKVIFGEESMALSSKRIASTQTISGTGAFHIAALFLARSVLQDSSRIAHIGLPTWNNYLPMLKLVGLDAEFYKRYDPVKTSIDFDSVLQAVRSAPEGSPFILQACCHNPTSADFTKDQWHTLADEMELRGHLPIFDIAYQGLGNGLDEDAYAVRYFEARGFEMLVCQSFSKNFALYGERCGALHVVCPSEEIAASVHDQLRYLIRSEFSSSPAFGARIVESVLSDRGKRDMWYSEIDTMRGRLRGLREQLFYLLTSVLQTPGDWSMITRGTGLFSPLPLTPAQCSVLQERFHIYLVNTGRINISGLNEENLMYFARSLDEVVREGINQQQEQRSSL